MNTIHLDPSSGSLSLDSVAIAPKSVGQLRDAFSRLGLAVREMHPNNDLVAFALSGELRGEEFGINITYRNEELHSVWLAWDGGITKKKGYETSEKELLTDKNQLSRFVSKILGKPPDVKEYTHDVFQFRWGRISVAASLKSTIVSIGLHWSTELAESADKSARDA